MELNSHMVRRIAELARLELTEEEVVKYQADLQKVLSAFSDLENVPLPAELQGDARSALTLKQAQNFGEESSRMQADVATDSLSSQNFLAQAPEREGVFVRVPAILNSTT
ncbi:MAG: Asp-tRNA(Asn)/Glu-tRNA(Gln) amidotransferase subunit GatC [Bdellovibrionota bacterium]